LRRLYHLRAFVGRYSKGSMSYETACTIPYGELRRYAREINALLEEEQRKAS